MFEEKVSWAVEASVTFIIAEPLDWYGGAALALHVIAGTGLPALVTLAPHVKELLDKASGN